MAKKKLEMVKVTDKELNARSLAAMTQIGTATLPNMKGFKKLSRPALVKCSLIPVGSAVFGEIIGVQDSLSSRKDMADAKLFHLRNMNDPKNPVDFLLPITGVIKQAVGGIEEAKKLVGKTLFVVRNANGETSKYGGKKFVYMFDVYIK